MRLSFSATSSLIEASTLMAPFSKFTVTVRYALLRSSNFFPSGVTMMRSTMRICDARSSWTLL